MKIQDSLLNAGKYSCLALCYIYIAFKKINGIEPDFKTLWKTLGELSQSNALDDEFFVTDGNLILFHLTGKHSQITKISSEKDIKPLLKDGNPYPVLYSTNGYSGHWVVMQNNKIVFNSLENSESVKKGKIISLRKIVWA